MRIFPAVSLRFPEEGSSAQGQSGAFETDLPNLERHAGQCDATTGAGCTVPPAGAGFYPMYTTAAAGSSCVWREGGPALPGALQTFGGTPASEYGGLLFLDYADGHLLEDNRRILSNNPCPA